MGDKKFKFGDKVWTLDPWPVEIPAAEQPRLCQAIIVGPDIKNPEMAFRIITEQSGLFSVPQNKLFKSPLDLFCAVQGDADRLIKLTKEWIADLAKSVEQNARDVLTGSNFSPDKAIASVRLGLKYPDGEAPPEKVPLEGDEVVDILESSGTAIGAEPTVGPRNSDDETDIVTSEPDAPVLGEKWMNIEVRRKICIKLFDDGTFSIYWANSWITAALGRIGFTRPGVVSWLRVSPVLDVNVQMVIEEEIKALERLTRKDLDGSD